jgi:ribosome-binding factor A
VTRVSTSPDLRHAKIFISMLGNEEEKREVLVALAVASGFLRKELSTRLRLRQSPQLSFYYDDSMEQAAEVLQLISQVSSETGGSAGGR